MPRSSLAPILRFADVEAYLQQAPDGGKDGTMLDGFVQIGVAKEDQPHYLKILARPGADVAALDRTSRSGSSPPGRSGTAGTGTTTASSRLCERTNSRSIAYSRTMASAAISTVTLLMKETLVRVAEPALVPAVR